ncbi:MAG: hypothetical protein HQK50_09345 [Oligoflexia bacterium]|nr:hypothetical protein [Oligoflexia bacterium]
MKTEMQSMRDSVSQLAKFGSFILTNDDMANVNFEKIKLYMIQSNQILIKMLEMLEKNANNKTNH